MLGSWLEIEVKKLQQIQKDYRTSGFCMMHMLNTWMQRCKDVCKLVDALKNIGEEDLAAKIAKKHGNYFNYHSVYYEHHLLRLSLLCIGLKDPVIHHYDTQQV